jgi:toxin ParE1/3/4
MPRYRLSDPAKIDIAAVLRASETIHGAEARIRYRALLTAAMRRIAAEPLGLSTVDRSELSAGIRCFHVRHAAMKAARLQLAIPCT